MGLIDLLRKNVQTITTNSAIGFSQDVTFTTPDETDTVTVKALFTSHHSAFDQDGLPVSLKVASVAVSESVLNEAGYVTRNGSGVVFLEGHRVLTKDSTGEDILYLVTDRKPDNELGLIVLMLNEFSE